MNDPTNDATIIPEGELLSYGFCKFGVEDKDNRWVAEEPLLVIPLKSLGLMDMFGGKKTGKKKKAKK